MTGLENRYLFGLFLRFAAVLLVINGAVLWLGAHVVARQEIEPRPVRNNIARPWSEQEVLMLRHQRLMPGSHQAYYEASRNGVWPWFEKIGARIVGQWQVVHPDGPMLEEQEYIEGWRLARYASYDHWLDTRQGVPLGGNGPDWQASRRAGRTRRQFQLGSDGGHFLRGVMHDSQPLHMTGLSERYRLVSRSDQSSDIVAVRNDSVSSGEEIIALRYWKINKGTFERFLRSSIEDVWPWHEKVGARVVGQWKVIYPERASDVESAAYDEVYMMTRYASYDHWLATRPQESVAIGGNGPDWQNMMDAGRFRQSLTIETSVQFLQGYFYESPPVYLPGLDERYQLAQ